LKYSKPSVCGTLFKTTTKPFSGDCYAPENNEYENKEIWDSRNGVATQEE